MREEAGPSPAASEGNPGPLLGTGGSVFVLETFCSLGRFLRSACALDALRVRRTEVRSELVRFDVVFTVFFIEEPDPRLWERVSLILGFRRRKLCLALRLRGGTVAVRLAAVGRATLSNCVDFRFWSVCGCSVVGVLGPRALRGNFWERAPAFFIGEFGGKGRGMLSAAGEGLSGKALREAGSIGT